MKVNTLEKNCAQLISAWHLNLMSKDFLALFDDFKECGLIGVANGYVFTIYGDVIVLYEVDVL